MIGIVPAFSISQEDSVPRLKCESLLYKEVRLFRRARQKDKAYAVILSILRCFELI